MSFLTGLYLLGAAAVTFPVLFHLIRRTPRGRLPFSSLMFLMPSPPRLTRRSRLDHLLLLLLRALAIILLAFAFMRPFFRQLFDAGLDNVRGRRVAIVLDTSASMKRADLWQQAIAQASLQVDALEPADDVALFTFADRVTTVVGFSEDKRVEFEQKRTLVRDALTRLGPTWAHTDLATALMSIAESLDVITDRTNVDAVPQILLISDMQQGARLQTLEGYQWPPEVNVQVQYVAPTQATTNASLRLLVDAESGLALSTEVEGRGEDRQREAFGRVRVENAPDSTADQFYVRWSSPDGHESDNDVAFHVPAGQSRVLRVPHTDEDLNADRLTLSGDDCPYDNVHYVVPLQQEQVNIVYVGDDDPMDPDGLLFYLRMALPETRRRRVDLEVAADDELAILSGGDAPRLVVVTRPLSSAQQPQLDQYVKQGGTVLAVLRDAATAKSFGAALDGVTVSETDHETAGQYALLGTINFEHPFFSPFAASGYSDFTMIHFWQHRRVVLDETSSAHVLARFDNDNPAVLEQSYGQGKFVLLASGWNPRDSQLARSWKFAVLLSAILEQSGGPSWQSPTFAVNETVTLPVTSPPSSDNAVITPDGSEVRLPEGANVFGETHMPGIYRANWQGNEHEFAVNVASIESKTAPLDADKLETLGVRLGQHATRSEETDRLRQLRDLELESKQQVWRWLIVGALVILIFETWLAGHYSRVPVPAAGETV